MQKNFISSAQSNNDSGKESSVENKQAKNDRNNINQRKLPKFDTSKHSKTSLGKRDREEEKQKNKNQKPKSMNKNEKEQNNKLLSFPERQRDFGTFSNNEFSSIEMGDISDLGSVMKNFSKQGKVKKESNLEIISISSMCESASKKNRRELKQKQKEQKGKPQKRSNTTLKKRDDQDSSQEELLPITEQEMRMGLFHMKQKKLKFIHLNRNMPAYLKQEEFFQESQNIQKINNLLSILNIELENEKTGQMELRHIMFGLKNRKFNQVYEFQRDENNEILIYENPKGKYLNFSAMVVYQNQLIITGGSGDISDQPQEQTYRYFLQIDPENDQVHMDRDENFPPLNIKRSDHNAFVYRHYLFIIFGSQEDIEYLDLNEAEPAFRVLKFENQYNLMRPMIFIHKDINERERIYIFGGSALRKNKVNKLYELEIKFQMQGNDLNNLEEPSAAALIEHNFDEGSYGSSQFYQNLPNQYYYEDQKIWMFLDDQGQLYSFDLENKKHKAIDVKLIKKQSENRD
ncbi:UNKNOWN [Stylonychia lemnae]|uniref:Kelch motif family protein n=1 Tax=Stylonychia lemnae TaxID=5949 RepID=A0A077ZYP0_STYLE|nr:UNKNOWN [Stylonychia lemnae]|eukprot:CDW74727.1 UNKNOWN [Stylonychia lemnae]